jgi:hypothetical protein
MSSSAETSGNFFVCNNDGILRVTKITNPGDIVLAGPSDYPTAKSHAMRIARGGEILEFGTYRHFKGDDYEVLGTAIHSETKETMVIYCREQHTWVRPMDMFFDDVSQRPDNVTGQKTRFEKV